MRAPTVFLFLFSCREEPVLFRWWFRLMLLNICSSTGQWTQSAQCKGDSLMYIYCFWGLDWMSELKWECCGAAQSTVSQLRQTLSFSRSQYEDGRGDGAEEGAGSRSNWHLVDSWWGADSHRLLGHARALFHPPHGLQTGQLHREGACSLWHVNMQLKHVVIVTFSYFLIPQLQLFTFKKKDDVRSFICEHIQCVGTFKNTIYILLGKSVPYIILYYKSMIILFETYFLLLAQMFVRMKY